MDELAGKADGQLIKKNNTWFSVADENIQVQKEFSSTSDLGKLWFSKSSFQYSDKDSISEAKYRSWDISTSSGKFFRQ